MDMIFLRNHLVHWLSEIHEEIPQFYHTYFYILKNYRNDEALSDAIARSDGIAEYDHISAITGITKRVRAHIWRVL